jgi:hypothetical protein
LHNRQTKRASHDLWLKHQLKPERRPFFAAKVLFSGERGDVGAFFDQVATVWSLENATKEKIGAARRDIACCDTHLLIAWLAR